MRRLIPLLVLLLIWNVGLVAVSWGLARHSEHAYPPIGELVEIDGLTVHVRDFGAPAARPDAPTVVLIHGASTSLLDFEASLAPALRADFRVVSVDRPGHGYSERGSEWPDPYQQAATLRGALDAAGIKQAIWIGHSWAGAVVLAALLEQADHAVAGVLLAGATHPWEGGSTWHAEFAARPLLGRLFAWQYIGPVGRLMLDDAISTVFDPESVPSDYLSNTGVTLSLRPEAFRANAADLTGLSDHLQSQSARYPELDQPILSITGTADTIVPGWNHDARLKAQLPSIQSIALDGAGHGLHHTRASTIAAAVKQFSESSLQR